MNKILNILTFGIHNFNTKMAILLALILIIIAIYIILAISHVYIKKIHKRRHIFMWLSAGLGCVILLFLLSILIPRPYGHLATPTEDGQLLQAHMPIVITFDNPVDAHNLTMHISPEIKGEWKFTNILPINTSLKHQAIFYPEESFYPDTKIVVYIVGLQSLFPGSKAHEQAIEFFSPKTPNIAEIIPASGQEKVDIADNIEIIFDNPSGMFAHWQFHFEPEIQFQINKVSDKKYLLEPKETLFQDTQYALSISRSLQTYNVKDFSPIKIDTEDVFSMTFHTVSPPLIEEHAPQGEEVRSNSQIRIVFDEDMDKEDVEKHIIISPTTTGTISWENEKTFVFTPTKELKKDTKYIITVKKDMLTAYGGKTEEDVELYFKTLGSVALKNTFPASNSYGIQLDIPHIAITFNQGVDHDSAQSSFSLSPNVPGTFSWENNTMIYSFTKKLDYSKKYQIHLDKNIKSLYGQDSIEDFSYLFLTKNKVFTLKIPMYYQEEDFTCNLAATSMILKYRGITQNEANIKSSIGIGGDPNKNWVSEYGVHWGPIAQYISQYRKVAIKTGWNISELAHEVERGNPVIIWWHNNYSPSGAFTLPSGVIGYEGMHSEIVSGFVGNADNPITLITNDPWRGIRHYSRKNFLATWGYLGYTALVVY